jgi:hypothetical protein
METLEIEKYGSSEDERSPESSSRYLIDPIWPKREVHIITGESGVGKTTLLTQWVNDLVAGRPILGFRFPPQKVVYVSNERSQESLEIDNDARWKLRAPFYTIAKAMEGVKVPPKDRWSYAGLVGLIEKYAGEGFEVMVVDPIVTFCPKPNDQNEVHRFLYTLAQNELKRFGVTVIASGHPPKEREGQKILNIRQKVAGSQGWGSFSNCNMHLEPANDENRMETRVRLEVRSRHAPPMEFFFDRDEIGRLVEIPSEEFQSTEFIMLRVLEGKKVLTTAESVAWGETRGVERRNVTRWLKRLEAGGVLEHQERGVWRVNQEVGYTAFSTLHRGEAPEENDYREGQEEVGSAGEDLLVG